VDGAQQIDGDWGMSAAENRASAQQKAKKTQDGSKNDWVSAVCREIPLFEN